MNISRDVANFSLAEHANNQGDIEEIKSEDGDADVNDDEDGPQTYKAKFVRRSTMVRQQLLNEEDN